MDFVWVMDDDLFVKEDTLEKLLEANEIVEAAGEKASFFASAIYTITGENTGGPPVDDLKDEMGKPRWWYKYLDKGIVGINRAATLSLLIRKEAIVRCGNYPKFYYSVYGADSEYTMRLHKYWGAAYFVGSSVAIHKKYDIYNFEEKDKTRLKVKYYCLRNDTFNARFYRHHNTVAQFYRTCRTCVGLLGKPNGLYIASRIMKGWVASLFCHKRFARYIKDELEAGRKAWEEQYGRGRAQGDATFSKS